MWQGCVKVINWFVGMYFLNACWSKRLVVWSIIDMVEYG